MNTYLFYTDEGYTVAPNNNKLDSLQILGIEEGKTEDEALVKLFRNNEWIIKESFSKSRISSFIIIKSNS
ncbi:MAG: hypothetical protein ACI4TD_10345 [Phocaeicola sp.]